VPLGPALDAVARRAAPSTPLARVQELWAEAAGAEVAARAEPIDEQAGTVVVGCESALWAQELSLLAPRLLERVNEALDRRGEPFRASTIRTVVRPGSERFGADS
jgi:predicted nucleic acid-binding Zn ribbon protein